MINSSKSISFENRHMIQLTTHRSLEYVRHTKSTKNAIPRKERKGRKEVYISWNSRPNEKETADNATKWCKPKKRNDNEKYTKIKTNCKVQMQWAWIGQ